MKKITFLWCFLLGFSVLLTAQHLTTEEEFRLLNAQTSLDFSFNESHDVDHLLDRLSDIGNQVNGVEEFFSQDEILALRNYFSLQNRSVMGGPCDQAIEITSGDIVNQPLVCGTEDLLNSGNVSPFCEDDFGPGGTIPIQYGNGLEATYTYTPGSTGTATLTVDETTWTMIQVFENGCPLTGGTCVTGARSITDTRTVTWTAEEGVEYFIWIDSWPSPPSPCAEGGQMTFSGPEPAGGGGGTGVPTAFGINNPAPSSYGSFEISNPAVFTGLSAGSGTADFEGAGAIDHNDNDTAYVIDSAGAMWSVDVQTGVYTSLGNVGVSNMTGLEFNPVDGNLYGTTTTAFYSIDIGAVSATLIGSLGTTGALAIALAIDGGGNAYTYDIADDLFYSINTATGAATVIGPIGFDANFGQGMAWDAETDQVYMAAFNNSLFDSELRLVNTTTGSTTSLGTIIPGTLSQIGWVSIINSGTGGGGGGGDCEWVVNVFDSGFGDEVSWELREGATVLLSGGPYGLGYNDTQSIMAGDGPMTFYIETFGAFNDNTPTYSVTAAGVVVASGTMAGGTETTHSDLMCDSGGGDPEPVYCAPIATSGCAFDRITNVTYAGINNSSDCPVPGSGGYSDYTDQVATVAQGTTNQISVTIVSDPNNRVYAFIDWDQSGTPWDIATERYAIADNVGSGTYTMNITVPADAALGNTRMRVATIWSTPGINWNGCDNFAWGEIEDYTVNVIPMPPPNDLIQNAISVTNETQPYTDPDVALQHATNELLNPDGCAIAGTNGVWYSFTASASGTAEAYIETPAGTSAVIFYEAPSEDVGDETDLTFNFEVTNQCAPGTETLITTEAGQSYYIFVLNTGGPSDVVIDISNSLLGTEDNTIDGFVMYPNPANNVLNLNSSISIDTVEVYNMLGQKVLAQAIGATSSQLDVSGLSTGNYLIKVNAEGQTATYQFIKK